MIEIIQNLVSLSKYYNYYLDKPKVRIESQNRYPLTVNSTATFRCIVYGNPEPQLK